MRSRVVRSRYGNRSTTFQMRPGFPFQWDHIRALLLWKRSFDQAAITIGQACRFFRTRRWPKSNARSSVRSPGFVPRRSRSHAAALVQGSADLASTTRPSVCCRTTTNIENFRRLVLGCIDADFDSASKSKDLFESS